MAGKKQQAPRATLERLAVEYVSTTSIHANEWNPNRQAAHEFNMLRRSIREDGFTQPVVVVRDGEGYKIVDGEHRWRAADAEGMTEVPVVVVPMGEVQARIATLRHNRARGTEDIDLTAALFRDLERLGALDWAKTDLAMPKEEVDRLLAESAATMLAAADYSPAWNVGDQVEDAPEEVRQVNPGYVVAMTPGAVQALREREAAVRVAQTREDRDKAHKDTAVYKVVAVFTGEEAGMVKAVLGDRPAAAILAMCQQAQAQKEPEPV